MKLFPFFFILFFLTNCGEDTPVTPEVPTEDSEILGVEPSSSPMNLQTADVSFYQNIAYGSFARNVFDIFIPKSDVATSLAIYIHGGGFVGGDKSGRYNEADFVEIADDLLSQGIAMASINYRLLGFGETQGVLKSLGDSKYALQFIRHHADALNIDKNKIVLMGGSAGAGTSLWLGLQDDLADASNADEVLRESTRVQGIVAIETQSSYDVLEWHNSTFAEYQDDGIGYDELLALVGELTAAVFYGVSSVAALDSDEIRADRASLDMLAFFSSDDPDIYVNNSRTPYTIPVNSDEVLHHPLHAKALMDKAAEMNVSCQADIVQMNINTTNGESFSDFIIRKIGN